MNLVDSSAWLEYFADGPNADFFAPAVQKVGELIVPTVVLYEVYQVAAAQRDDYAGLQAVSVLQQGHVVELNASLALAAARLSRAEKLPMADSIILSSARAFGATIWTQDADFGRFPEVKFRAKR